MEQSQSGLRHSTHTPCRPYTWKASRTNPQTETSYKFHYQKKVTFKIHNWTPQNQQLWTLKLPKPSSNSDEDSNECEVHSSSNEFTIGLVSDCPTVTFHARKRFKVLIDSAVAISLMHTSVYNMIEDHYKTSILPAVVNLKSPLGYTHVING